MKTLAILVSITGLLLTVVPSFFVLYQVIPWTLHAWLMGVGMVFWFASAPVWIKTD
jgi:hypothetical protein